MCAAPAERPRLFLIDAYALIYRSYFAFIRRPLTNSRGENTSAPFGFANFLYGIRDDHAPDYLAVVFDAGYSRREEIFPAYKATRSEMPQELRDSLPRIRELVEAFGDRTIELEGWEADDVIGTLARRAVAKGFEAVIVSGDKDFYQLLGERVSLLNPGRGGPQGVAAEMVTSEGALAKFGVEPGQMVDFLALVGDSSDNVPGAPGIGPKTAQTLLREHGTLDALLAVAPDLRAKRPRESLLGHRDQILLSRELVTIHTDLPVQVELADLRVGEPDSDRLRSLFVDLEFRTLVERIDAEASGGGVEVGEGVEEGVGDAEYILVSDPRTLPEIARACREEGMVAISILTTTLNPMRGEIAAIALAADPSRIFYLPLAHSAEISLEVDDSAAPATHNLPPIDSSQLEPIRALLADPAIAKIGHDLKASWVACRRKGIDLAGPLHDVMVASYLLDPGRRHRDLLSLASDILGRTLIPQNQLLGKGRKRRDYGEIGAGAAHAFGCERVEASLLLRRVFATHLAAQPELDKLFAELEMPLIPILGEMEHNGIAIDAEFFAGMSKRLGRELAMIRQGIHSVAGTDFNINSTLQLREVLFERLGLPVLKRTRTGPSTDSSVLEQLTMEGHELPRLMLDYRQLEKLRNTYVDALPTLVNSTTGRIHTTFNQAVAATGRLSSSEPNLQNIPVRTSLGREIRKGFVAGRGARLLTADYSQIELRILAHFSEDEVFVQAFRQGKDVHRETAAVLFDVPVENVTGEMRAQAKVVNFATLYGQGPFGLAQQLGISMDEAKRFIAHYFERFAGVRVFLDRQVEQARASGHVETLLGRRRQIPELQARSWNVRQFGERVARNTPIQGTAADLIKVAMIRVAGALANASGVRMLLQVHDELVFEVEKEKMAATTQMVVGAMESALTLKVPLQVDTGTGQSWYDCKG